MKTIKKQLVFNDKRSFYLKHLEVIEPHLPIELSKKEMEILSAFMSIDLDNKFSTEGRKMVKSMLTKLSDGGLGNYLRELKSKGVILADTKGNLYIHQALLPTDNSKQEYIFTLVFDENWIPNSEIK